jgi:hypothetical protein
VSRFACLIVFLACSLTMTAGGASSRDTETYACAIDQLAFALSEPSAPMQTQAVGFVVYNTDRAACRLALPIALTLKDSSSRHLPVAPQSSRLTLVARRFGSHAKAGVTWTYTNYCGSHNAGEQLIMYSVHVKHIELRASGDAPPCHNRKRSMVVDVLFACPDARGPAIAAVLPRPLKLCPR